MRSLLVRSALAVVVGAVVLTADVGFGFVRSVTAGRGTLHAPLPFKHMQNFFIPLSLVDEFDANRAPLCYLHYLDKQDNLATKAWKYVKAEKIANKRWKFIFMGVKPDNMKLSGKDVEDEALPPGLGSGNVTVTVPTKTSRGTPSFDIATSEVVEVK